MSSERYGALRGRRVLVTGHTGFKGAWLSLWLARLGAEVHGYALAPPTDPSCYDVCRVAELLAADTRADVRDANRLAATVGALAPDVIFHLAAQSLVRESYAQPVETFAVNVQGTVHVLDAVRRSGRGCVVVVVTSDKCYENGEHDRGYSETDALGGHDPYSASKGAAEIVTASYRRSFFDPENLGRHGVRLASARAGNVIGGGDWADDRIVPDVLRALSKGEPAVVRNPGSVRPWQHVLEPLSGYLHLAARLLGDDDPALCSAWNFGPRPGDEATVGELVERILAAWGSGKVVTPEQVGAPHEARTLRLNIDKASNLLGWRPRLDLATAVERTVTWARTHHEGGDVRAACHADIDVFERAGGAS